MDPLSYKSKIEKITDDDLTDCPKIRPRKLDHNPLYESGTVALAIINVVPMSLLSFGF